VSESRDHWQLEEWKSSRAGRQHKGKGKKWLIKWDAACARYLGTLHC